MYPRKAPHWILLKYISIFWITNAKHTIQTNWEVLGRGWNGLLFFLFSILWPQSGIWILGYGGITRCSSITAPSKRGVVTCAFHYSHAAYIQHPQPLIFPYTHTPLAWTNNESLITWLKQCRIQKTNKYKFIWGCSPCGSSEFKTHGCSLQPCRISTTLIVFTEKMEVSLGMDDPSFSALDV